MIAVAPMSLGLMIALFASTAVAGQEPPILQDMEWRRDDTGELTRNYRGMWHLLDGRNPFGHLFNDTPEVFALLPLTHWRNDPPSILGLILTGNSDVSARIGARRFYQLLELHPDIEFLRGALTDRSQPGDHLARLDKLIALRFVEQQSIEGLVGAVFSLDREPEDAWVRAAARTVANAWQGETGPSRPPAIPPRELPENHELLVYILPPRIPDPSPLFAAFRRMEFQYAQRELRAGGSSFSPGQLEEFQDAIDLPQVRPYEVIRRFGLYQLDSFLYCTKGTGDARQFLLEAQGRFELPDLLDGLSHEGLEMKEDGKGSYTASGSPWGFRVAKEVLRVKSEDYVVAESKDQELDLRSSDAAAIALLDFESLSKSIPWLATLGKRGSIRLSFTASNAVLELRSDGDANQFSDSFNRFCENLDQRIEGLLADGFGRGNRSFREYGSNLPWISRPLDPDPLLDLLQSIEIQERKDGLTAKLTLTSNQLDPLARAWFTLVLDPDSFVYLEPKVQVLPETAGGSGLEVECRLVNHSTRTVWYRGKEEGAPSEYEIHWQKGGVEHQARQEGEWHALLPGKELRFRHSMSRRSDDQFRLMLGLHRWKNEGLFWSRSLWTQSR